MSGPEHYKAAEDLLGEAVEAVVGSDEEMWAVAAAQVHATLALAAATMDAANGTHIRDWSHAIGGAR